MQFQLQQKEAKTNDGNKEAGGTRGLEYSRNVRCEVDKLSLVARSCMIRK